MQVTTIMPLTSCRHEQSSRRRLLPSSAGAASTECSRFPSRRPPATRPSNAAVASAAVCTSGEVDDALLCCGHDVMCSLFSIFTEHHSPTYLVGAVPLSSLCPLSIVLLPHGSIVWTDSPVFRVHVSCFLLKIMEWLLVSC